MKKYFSITFLMLVLILYLSCERSVVSPDPLATNQSGTFPEPLQQKIVFAALESTQNYKSNIYMMDPDGGNLVNLTKDLPESSMPSFSPDGENILFVCNGQLTIMDHEGQNVRTLTSGNLHRWKSFPVFSPDGSKIAFFAKPQHYSDRLDVYILNSDGSGLSNLTSQNGDNLYPTFSPDGNTLLYWKLTENTEWPPLCDIYLQNLSGGPAMNLTREKGFNCFPQYSQDGLKIVFISRRENDVDYSLYVMNADGSEPHRIFAAESGRMVTFPKFTPDGNRIVFLYYSVSTNQKDTDICIINTNGSGFRNLTSSPYRDWGTVLSSDGSKIVFESDRDGNDEIYMMTIDGGNLTRLTNSPQRTDMQPTFRYAF